MVPPRECDVALFLSRNELVHLRRIFNRGALCAVGKCPSYRCDYIGYYSRPLAMKINAAFRLASAMLSERKKKVGA